MSVGVARSLRVAGLALVCALFIAPLPAYAEFMRRSGSATLVSEAGDYIGQGTDRLYDAPRTLSISGDLSGVDVSANAGPEWATFVFAPPSGSKLEVGEYTNAESSSSSVSPELSVFGSGRSCKSFGRFIIRDIHTTSTGVVNRFWALYEQHCESPHAPALFGEVRVGEPQPRAPEKVEPRAIAWPTTWVGSAGVPVPVTVIARKGGAHVASVGVQGANPGDFRLSNDGCEARVMSEGERCEVDVAAMPTAPGNRVAQLVITDSSGAKTSDALSVHAEPLLMRSSATMVSESGDYIGQGIDRLLDAPGRVYATGGLGHVRVAASGEAGEFSFDFAPPSGVQLEDGEYTGAERYPFEHSGQPGISVTSPGRGCNNDFGRFVVKDIHVDGSGNVDRFWALYEQHCENTEAPALFGEVRVGEAPTGAPEAVEPAAIDWPSTAVGSGGVAVPVVVSGGELGAQVSEIRVEGADSSDFSVANDGCEGVLLSAGAQCQLEVDVKPTATGGRSAELVVVDGSGATTTVSLDVAGV